MLWKCVLKEREDINIDFEKISFDETGYLGVPRFNGRNWEEPVILHREELAIVLPGLQRN